MAEAERKGQNEDGVRATQIVYCVNSASMLRRFVSVQRTDAHVRRVHQCNIRHTQRILFCVFFSILRIAYF